MKNIIKSAITAVFVFGSTSTVAKAESEPFIGTIGTFGQNFCPRGWSKADGKLLPIGNNTALFSLLGTNYGGDGRTTFGLPNLIGRANLHAGRGPGLTTRRMGEIGGTTTTTQTIATMPNHSHFVSADIEGNIVASSAAPNTGDPSGAYLGTFPAGSPIYGQSSTPPVTLGQGSIAFNSTIQFSNAGGGQSVENQQPYLSMMICVATVGLYPSRS